MSIVHGSRGLIYFVHQFKPRFIEAALLGDREMLAAVTKINARIRELAPVLNSPSLPGVATVTSSAKDVPIAVMVKRHGGATYVFAVAMRDAPTTGTFRLKLKDQPKAVEVLGEGRRLKAKSGRFTDKFGPYDVHLYKLR